MLSQVGCITLPAETLTKVYGGQPLSDEENKLYESHPEVAGKLLGQIPRLEDVAGMVAGQLRAPGKDRHRHRLRQPGIRSTSAPRFSGPRCASISW